MPKFNLVLNIIGQIYEVRADLSSKKYHYGDHLINALYSLSEKMQLKHTIPFSLAFYNHPSIYKRIEYLS